MRGCRSSAGKDFGYDGGMVEGSDPPVGVNLLRHEVHGDKPASARALNHINYEDVSPLVCTGQWLGGSSSRPQIRNSIGDRVKKDSDRVFIAKG